MTAKADKSDNTVLSAINRKFTEQLNLRFELNVLEMDSPMIFSTALDQHFHRLSFLSESQQSELLELLVSAAESITCNTASTTNESTDAAAESAEPPSKKRSVLDHLLGEEKLDDESSVQDEVKLYLQEQPIK